MTMNAISYRIVPLRPDFLQHAREAGLDDLQQPVEHHLAEGGEPCRDVLRRARPGERLILASYCPFSTPGPYREYGPIYILADDSGERAATDAMPLSGEPPYLNRQFVLRAYSACERIVDAALVMPADAEATLQQFLLRDEIAFVVARFAAYGCFSCRIERYALSATEAASTSMVVPVNASMPFHADGLANQPDKRVAP